MKDIFISYSRSDAAWAQKLHDDLVHPSRGLEVFLDTARIQAGDEWEQKLATNLVECRNLVLLWSRNAVESKWVDREASFFRLQMMADENKGRPTNRRILQVCLDGRNPEYGRWQALEQIDDPVQFENGAQQVDPNRWQELLDALTNAVHVDDASPLVHQLVLASKRGDMSLMPLNATLTGGLRFGGLLDQLGLKHPDFLEAYGEQRSDWRPFGNAENIVTLLARVRAELIASGAPRFRWKPVEDDFWNRATDDATVTGIVKRLTDAPSVVVIDPLSLYDAEVFGRYLLLVDDEYLFKPHTCLVVLSPYPTASYWSLSTAAGRVARQIYKRFYDPVFDDTRVPLASFSALVNHQAEIQRLLAASLRRSRQDFKQWWSAIP